MTLELGQEVLLDTDLGVLAEESIFAAVDSAASRQDIGSVSRAGG